MARTRLELQELLESLLGSRNVYFQPPPTIKMKYPAIVYHPAALRNVPADNNPYQQFKSYTVTVIDEDPDSIISTTVSKLPLCRFDRWYAADNLNHFTYTLYY